MSISNYPPPQGGVIKGTDGFMYESLIGLNYKEISSRLVTGVTNDMLTAGIYGADEISFCTGTTYTGILDSNSDYPSVKLAVLTSTIVNIGATCISGNYIYMISASSASVYRLRKFNRITKKYLGQVGTDINVTNASVTVTSICKDGIDSDKLWITLSTTTGGGTALYSFIISTNIITQVGSNAQIPQIQNGFKTRTYSDGVNIFSGSTTHVFKMNLTGSVVASIALAGSILVEELCGSGYIYAYTSGALGVLNKIRTSDMSIVATSEDLNLLGSFAFWQKHPNDSTKILGVATTASNVISDLCMYSLDKSTLIVSKAETTLTEDTISNVGVNGSVWAFNISTATGFAIKIVTVKDNAGTVIGYLNSYYAVVPIVKGVRKVV